MTGEHCLLDSDPLAFDKDSRCSFIFYYMLTDGPSIWFLYCFFKIWLHIEHYFGEGNGTPLQYSCLKNPMDRGAWKAAVHGVTEGQTRLSDFTFTFHFHALEKEMATHSSILAWRIPGTEEPSGLPSVVSHRVRHDWSDLAAAAAAAYIFCDFKIHVIMLLLNHFCCTIL